MTKVPPASLLPLILLLLQLLPTATTYYIKVSCYLHHPGNNTIHDLARLQIASKVGK